MKLTPYTCKIVIINLFFLLTVQTCFSQNVGISSSSSFTPDASAALDVSYTSKGLLIPRVALTSTNSVGPITSPATSLLVYNTASAGSSPFNVIPGYYYWNGTGWVLLSTSTQATGPWSTTGNTGTSYPKNFLGTTDNFGLHVKIGGMHRFWLDSLGSVAVGTNPIFSSTREKFLVDAGATSSFNVISGKGSLNGYLQLNIQNTNAGSSASSDIVATADNGTESTNYVDLGTNSSANTANLFGGANDSYLYSAGGVTSSTAGGNLYIGTTTAGKSLGLLTGGGTTGTPASGSTAAAANNERLHIDGTTGYIGLNNPSPSQVLDITGNFRFSGALMPNNNAGAAGNFLVSAGAGNAPVWFNANTYAWLTGGNAGTTAGTNFIGTTDAVDFVAKTNGAEKLRITSAGNIGINTATPTQQLDVNGTIVASGTTYPNYAYNSANRMVFGETNVPANEIGSVAQFGSGSTSRNMLFAITKSSTNTSFIGNDGNQTMIGSEGTANPITFRTGMVYSNANIMTTGNEWMRLTAAGNVGIGTTAPATKLHVFGANPLTLSGVVNGTNTSADSVLTITNGLVRKLALSTFAPTGSWSTAGNAGTTAGTNFIGTTDAVDFVAKTSNAERLRINSAGDVSIGGTALNSSNPEQLLVDAGTTSSYNIISGKGNLNSYLQLNIQNNNNGTGASSDVVASNSTATESTNYIDMGINSTANNTAGLLGGSNTAYLYATGNDFVIGNGTASRSLVFYTSGTNATATNAERMRIDPSGNVGIGTTAPAQRLDVTGSINASTSVISQGTVLVDAAIANTGSALQPGLQLGGSTSGEGITSKRTSGTNQYGVDIYTNGSLQMTVANSGNVGIGTITPANKLSVNGIVAPSSNNNFSLGTSTNRWTTLYATNGTISTSDRRLKTNIKTLKYGLKEVMALQPVSYNWKDKSQPQNKVGLIAQDVKKFIPEVVVGDETKEKLGMNYAELVPVLINAIKEQQQMIDKQQREIDVLKKILK